MFSQSHYPSFRLRFCNSGKIHTRIFFDIFLIFLWKELKMALVWVLCEEQSILVFYNVYVKFIQAYFGDV